MSVNKVILIGNVGQDPKITYYEGGNCAEWYADSGPYRMA